MAGQAASNDPTRLASSRADEVRLRMRQLLFMFMVHGWFVWYLEKLPVALPIFGDAIFLKTLFGLLCI